VVVLVTYDLHKPVKDYEKLISAIKSQYTTWWHYLESVWVLETSSSATEVGTYLRQFIDRDDRLMAIRVSKDYEGWLPADAWNWLGSKTF
jgi:hypothetical protein